MKLSRVQGHWLAVDSRRESRGHGSACRQAQEGKEHGAFGDPSETGFAEVRVSEPMPGPTVTIYLPGGAKLEAAVGTDPAWMGQLIKASAST